MIINQPGNLEQLTHERDVARRDYVRVADAAANLLGRLHAMVDGGELKTFPELEALEVALASPREDEP